MRQGDIYWYRFKQPNKRRPVLILTRDSALSFLTSVTVAPLTTTIRDIPTEVVLTPEDGVPTTSAISLDNIQTVPQAQLGTFITHLSTARMREVRAAIAFALGFDTLLGHVEEPE